MNYEYRVDPSLPVKPLALSGLLFTGDDRGDSIALTLVGDEASRYEGWSAALHALRADGVTAMTEGCVKHGRCVLPLTEECLLVPRALSVIVRVTNAQTLERKVLLDLNARVAVSQTELLAGGGALLPSIDELLAELSRLECALDRAERWEDASAALRAALLRLTVCGEGEVIAEDAAALPPVSLRLYGLSRQSDTPSPQSPSPIASCTDARITVDDAEVSLPGLTLHGVPSSAGNITVDGVRWAADWVDLITGDIHRNVAGIVLDGSTLSASQTSTAGVYRYKAANLTTEAKYPSSTVKVNGLCDYYPLRSAGSTNSGNEGISPAITTIYIYDERFTLGSKGSTDPGASGTDLQQFAQWMGEHPVTLLYELAQEKDGGNLRDLGLTAPEIILRNPRSVITVSAGGAVLAEYIADATGVFRRMTAEPAALALNGDEEAEDDCTDEVPFEP